VEKYTDTAHQKKSKYKISAKSLKEIGVASNSMKMIISPHYEF
jgi:hypothetical protein